jgi:hypothetical protein
MRCEICGCEPCATPGFCDRARELDRDRAAPSSIGFEDFYAYAPENKFIFVPTGDRWPGATIDKRLPWMGKIKPSTWLHQFRPVEQMTWSPGDPQLIKDRICVKAGWLERPGTTVYNLYAPPQLEPGNAENVGPWLEHLRNIYPDDVEHILDWFAQRVQYPAVKVNHALLLGGSEGIGKDTLLAPVRVALGHHNCAVATPQQLVGRFNGHQKSVMLVAAEARDLGEISRYAFYDHLKLILAAPPDTLPIDEKHTHPYYIPNIVGVVMTTNYKAGGIHLNAEDRRHFVAWSPKEKTDFAQAYWDRLWAYYENGGYNDVASYLQTRDITRFNAKAPPPITAAHSEIVNASRPPEEADFDDALAQLGYPATVTVSDMTSLMNGVDVDFITWLRDPKNRRLFPRRFEASGYIAVANPDAKNGFWRLGGKKQTVYARNTMSRQEQFEAINRRR